MSVCRKAMFVPVFLLFLILILPVAAQDNTLPTGLLAPRGMAFDEDGTMYVAEAGVADDMQGPDDIQYGSRGQVSMIAPDGTQTVIARGFPNLYDRGPQGVSDVHVDGDSLWVAVGAGDDLQIPWSATVIKMDPGTARFTTIIDTLQFELDHDPDGSNSHIANPVHLAFAEDGTIYIADSSANALLSWTEEGGLQLVTAWPFEGDNPVPTSVDIGPDGDLYVGFLSTYPFVEGSARIERWSGGELVETFGELTAVTGILLSDDGTLFAVEHGTFDQDWAADSGRVVTVDENGITPVLENLNRPYAIEQAPDGTIYVTINSVTADGTVIPLP